MHCLRVEICVMLQSKHSKLSFLGQLDAELTFVVQCLLKTLMAEVFTL